jgi:HEAT repeat protein
VRFFTWMFLLMWAAAGMGQQPTGSESSKASQEETAKAAKESTQSPIEEAWEILQTGVHNKSADRRIKAIGVLGLVPRNRQVRQFAEKGLTDENVDVRTAAATALGEMHARESIPLLKTCLDDEDPGVALACARALLEMRVDDAYDVYYAILTGERKAHGSVISGQMKILKNPKRVAELGIEAGLGFVPFAGMGYTAYKLLSKDEVSPVRAAAARALANDPDPESARALADAVTDKSWIVRKAALDAIAKRGDRRMLKAVIPAMEDDKDIVMYTAAAAVVHLSQPRSHHAKM